MSDWTHTYRKPYEHRTLRLKINGEAPPRDGSTFWFLSDRGKERAFKISDPHLQEIKVKKK